MSSSRFNHVYTGFLLLSAACAFAVPREYSNRARGWIDPLFTPVAYPLRRATVAIAAVFRVRGNPAEPDRARNFEEAIEEIDRLRSDLAALAAQNDELRRLNHNRDLAGDVRQYSVPLRAMGDAAMRDSLTLDCSSDTLRPGMEVVYARSIVGKVVSASTSSARVRLVSDPGFTATAQFLRPQSTEGGRPPLVPLATSPPLVEGRGGGLMAITNLTMQQINEVSVSKGDWVTLKDPEDWPPLLQGYALGRVDKIEPSPQNTLYARIIVRPLVDLQQLSEVLVMTRHAPAPFALPAAAPPKPAPPPDPAAARKKIDPVPRARARPT